MEENIIQMDELCSICLDFIHEYCDECDISDSNSSDNENILHYRKIKSDIETDSTTTTDTSVSIRLNCNHLYHKNCIISWFLYRQKFICPLCKNDKFLISIQTLKNFRNCNIVNKKKRINLLIKKYYGDEYISDDSDDEGDEGDLIERNEFNRRRIGLKFWQFCLIYLGVLGLFLLIGYMLINVSSNSKVLIKRI